MRSCSDPCEARAVELLRPVFEVECRVTQTCVWSRTRNCSDSYKTRGYLDTRLKWNIKLLRPAFEVGCEVAQTRVRRGVYQTRIWNKTQVPQTYVRRGISQTRIWSLYFFFGREVRVLVKTRPSHWSEVRVWWSLVIFRQPTEHPPKFSILRGWLGQISKYFELQLILGSYDWTDNLSRCPEFDPIWILVFVSVLLNCLKPPGKIIISVLETQSSTYHKLWYICHCTIELIESSNAYASILLNW